MNVLERRRRRRLPEFADALEERVLLSQGLGALPAHSPHAEIQALGHHGDHAGAKAQAPTSARWNWLANTYWYVPTPNTPAILFLTPDQALLPLPDQTVFHVTGYRGGYFWGLTVTQLGSTTPAASSMIGSVTPEGRVLLNFTAMDGSDSPTITEGIGQMRRKFGQWTMENQMFTSSGSSAQVGHWAYMVQTRPGRPGWQSLPVAGVSVPQFLSNSPGPGPQPVVG